MDIEEAKRCEDCLFAEKGSCCWLGLKLENVPICGGTHFELKLE